jgi:hypothetical protein
MKGRALHVSILCLLVLGVISTLIRDGRLRPRRGPVLADETQLVSPGQISSAINGLDLRLAERLLRGYPTNQPEATILRARFALYRGDCDEARAILAANGDPTGRSFHELTTLAEGCARAMAAARIVNDDPRAVWVRLQDDADASWVSLIVEAAANARASAARKLGVSPNLPLRIELVMDHASLSALTGLPVEAAETTGTVAVARWGRITMMSPRAFPKGYPWQDTLAHEITHLLVTAASRDNSPLWLQEALAKHLETSWRPLRPHDGKSNEHEVARKAWLQGRSVGIERLGASIALLPNPDTANIAYAEVFDFLDYILQHASWNAVRLMLHELRELGQDGTKDALRSVTGYSLADWTIRWRLALSSENSSSLPASDQQNEPSVERSEELARQFRLAELFSSSDRYEAVSDTLSQAVLDRFRWTELRSLAGLARLQMGSAALALDSLGSDDTLVSVQGEWLALRGRALSELGRARQAGEYFDWALAYAPTDERVSCEGYRPSTGDFGGLDPLPISPLRRPLCLAARFMASSAREPSTR